MTAKLDYRQGYYGNKEWNKFNTADKERQLEDALMLADPDDRADHRDGGRLTSS